MFLNWKTASAITLGLAVSTANANGPGHGYPGHGHPGHGYPGHGHPPHHGNDPDSGDWFTLGALAASLAITSTEAADDDHKEAIDRSDAIVEQVLNHELPEAFYQGFRSSDKYKDLDSYEIDLVLLDSLKAL